jgi:hypothetical protein
MAQIESTSATSSSELHIHRTLQTPHNRLIFSSTTDLKQKKQARSTGKTHPVIANISSSTPVLPTGRPWTPPSGDNLPYPSPLAFCLDCSTGQRTGCALLRGPTTIVIPPCPLCVGNVIELMNGICVIYSTVVSTH